MIQFKHPELLWALVLLIIPIIIHLFHLRRFKKTAFTNVAFLKMVKMTTRKSSQLKKWLILLARLGMLTSIILAFAQPFLPNTEDFNRSSELVIYLDNSFSMQAKGSNGSLLNEAKQQLINYLPPEEKFTLFTNDKVFENITRESLVTDLINLGFSNNQLSYESAFLKGRQYFSNSERSISNLIFISDFQEDSSNSFVSSDSTLVFGIIPLQPQNTNNISIDSLYFSDGNNRSELKVNLSNSGSPVENVSVSLYKDNQLLTKASTSIDGNSTVSFSISESVGFRGKIDILDNSLTYDNRMFFDINKPSKINVLSLNGTEDFFLRKIFTKDEFNYLSYSDSAIDYTKIPDQNLVIVNHLDLLEPSLIRTLIDFHDNGGSVLIMPSKESNLNSYNELFRNLNQPVFANIISDAKKVTDIAFDHPLLSDAFYSEISNFQYPEISSYFTFSNTSDAVYKFEDGNTLLHGRDRIFIFSADITESNSNFLSSPLIVPALYNMAKQSLKVQELYYQINEENSIVIERSFDNEDVVNLMGSDYSSIPRQRTYGKYIELKTIEDPPIDGHYHFQFKNERLKNLSFNFKRTESQLQYKNLSTFSNLTEWNNLGQAISDIKSTTDVKALWKWFVIFALVLLLVEMLILKYFE